MIRYTWVTTLIKLRLVVYQMQTRFSGFTSLGNRKFVRLEPNDSVIVLRLNMKPERYKFPLLQLSLVDKSLC